MALRFYGTIYGLAPILSRTDFGLKPIEYRQEAIAKSLDQNGRISAHAYQIIECWLGHDVVACLS